MAYGGRRYGGAGYGGGLAEDIQATGPTLAVEVAFTTGALSTPAWVDITGDVRSWDVSRGRGRELEDFQPGRCTVVLSNLERQYDSSYASGPWFGNLKPMRRIRVRETYNGVTYPVFDGYIDRWQLDYPAGGHDATATVTATDAFKIFARADLPPSAYRYRVNADAPALWWRLSEPRSYRGDALNSGTVGTVGDGTFVDAELGVDALVVNDPGASIRVKDITESTGSLPGMGVTLDDADYALDSNGSWAIEFWIQPTSDPIGGDVFVKDSGTKFVFGSEDSTPEVWQFLLINGTGTIFGVTANAAGQVANRIYHVVVKYGPNRNMAVYINGTKYTATASGRTAPPVTGTLDLADLWFLYTDTGQTPGAVASNFAVYGSAQAVDPLTDAQVLAHYNDGVVPWQDDQPHDRINRVLNLGDWPSSRRELDTGNVAFQSADITGQTVLEHMTKAARTEFGLLFVNRAGDVRLVSRARQATRVPDPAVVGDGSGEVPYRSIEFDDGDRTIRNVATVSRLNGVAKTNSNPSSVTEFGKFDYTEEGLLHRLDSYSQSYADWLVDEYDSPKRRVVGLTFGPVAADDEATVYPMMLGRELGDAVTVKNRPPGGGDPFEQDCVIEGVRHSGAPGGRRVTSWTLSPEFSEALF